MSDLEDAARKFLRRWSRRKRALEEDAADGAEPASPERQDADANAPPRAAAQSKPAPLAFDPATLPPIESIGAVSDVRAFLAPGVPEELTRAALRRVWAADPTIRDFIGLAENQWDFTKPDGVPGFGSLELTPELRRMIAGIAGEAPGVPSPERPAKADRDKQVLTAQALTVCDASAEQSQAPDIPVISETGAAALVDLTPQNGDSDAAMHNGVDEFDAPRFARRKHGGAVPK